MSATRSVKANQPTVLRRSARIAAKNGKTVVPVLVQALPFAPQFPAPVEKKPLPDTLELEPFAEQLESEVPIAELLKPVVDCRCIYCAPRRKMEIADRLRPLFAISNSPKTSLPEMCRVTREVYTIVDQEFDFIRSADFDPSGRFIKTTERKCSELMCQLQSQFSRGKVDKETYFATRQILAKVNKKFASLNSK